jgi:hypothetical protein
MRLWSASLKARWNSTDMIYFLSSSSCSLFFSIFSFLPLSPSFLSPVFFHCSFHLSVLSLLLSPFLPFFHPFILFSVFYVKLFERIPPSSLPFKRAQASKQAWKLEIVSCIIQMVVTLLITESASWVVSTPVSQSEDPGFRFQPLDWLSWLIFSWLFWLQANARTLSESGPWLLVRCSVWLECSKCCLAFLILFISVNFEGNFTCALK